ncbi:MAG TPA: rod shape-determining protein MreD [Candidatus Moranbacteria bacterium]|nr:rod shape-determining protein MreD [Candidatus Moranbacteria bacterium]HAT74716.1 rod shape-determining protein MreD [Candidatus Moranbacteria bacterium]
MPQKVIIFLIIFFAVILQSAVFSNVFFLGTGPNILLLFVVFLVSREGFEKALGKIILAGFILDLASFYPVGMNVFSFAATAFLVSFFSKRFLTVSSGWHMPVLFFLVILSALANELLLAGLFQTAVYFKSLPQIDLIFSLTLSVLLKKIFLNILFFPVVYFLLLKNEKFLSLIARKKMS